MTSKSYVTIKVVSTFARQKSKLQYRQLIDIPYVAIVFDTRIKNCNVSAVFDSGTEVRVAIRIELGQHEHQLHS